MELFVKKLYETAETLGIYWRFQINMDDDIFLNLQVSPSSNVCTTNVFEFESKTMDQESFLDFLQQIIKNTNEWQRIKLKYYGRTLHSEVLETEELFESCFKNFKNAKIVVVNKYF